MKAVEPPTRKAQQTSVTAVAHPLPGAHRGRSEGHVTPHYEVRLCRACPNAVIEVEATAQLLVKTIEASGWCQALEERNNGSIRLHEKFRAAVAGCPNACSEPQIRDFGVIGQKTPGRGEPECIQCSECQAACREEAVEVEDVPHLDEHSCVHCGSCVAACPTGALVEEGRGYRVIAGGKLGRHPRLADTLSELSDAARVRAAARVALELMMEEEMRLGDILEREGLQRMLTWVRCLHEAGRRCSSTRTWCG